MVTLVTGVGGIVADDWKSIHWHKIEYLTTCGLKPWYLDHTDTDTCHPSTLPPPALAATMSPEAPHVLALQQQQQQQQQPQQQQQQQPHNQFEHPAGQQQAWVYAGISSVPNQATVLKQWQDPPGGGGASGFDVQAVVRAGQPWESSPGRWQCDISITLINKGDVSRYINDW